MLARDSNKQFLRNEERDDQNVEIKSKYSRIMFIFPILDFKSSEI